MTATYRSTHASQLGSAITAWATESQGVLVKPLRSLCRRSAAFHDWYRYTCMEGKLATHTSSPAIDQPLAGHNTLGRPPPGQRREEAVRGPPVLGAELPHALAPLRWRAVEVRVLYHAVRPHLTGMCHACTAGDGPHHAATWHKCNVHLHATPMPFMTLPEASKGPSEQAVSIASHGLTCAHTPPCSPARR